MKKFILSKKEFIKRSMKGEKFKRVCSGSIYSCDVTRVRNPFMINGLPLEGAWESFDGIKLFTLVEPEPSYEDRWIWLKDAGEGYTVQDMKYVTDEHAEKTYYTAKGWYKSDMKIRVEVKD